MRRSNKPKALGIRWTIGDVSAYGFEALRLSVWGAFRIFGERAAYRICVNTIPLSLARKRTGELPDGVVWQDASEAIPDFLARHLDEGMAEGTGWKLAPLQVFPDRHELSLDNDCILWELPDSIRRWLEDEPGDSCLVAEDVRAYFGRFSALCGSAPRNLGIRGLPPGFDLAAALGSVLREAPGLLVSELDEQGLQMAALARQRLFVVRLEEVSICSPFPPHLPHLGRCGAHFVSLNAKSLGWSLSGRPAEEHTREHWARHRGALYERVGVAPSPLMETEEETRSTER